MDTRHMFGIVPYILPPSIILVAIIVGSIADRIIQRKLTKLATKTRWEGDDIIIQALQGIFKLWFLLFGIYVALPLIPFKREYHEIFTNIIVASLIFSFTIILARIASSYLALKTQKVQTVLPSTSIIVNITRWTIYVLGALIILQTMGISITPILTALGVGGLAVALALQDTLSNLFAGLHILLTRQIRPGDYIKLSSGEEGIVADITWRNTTIQQLANNLIIIPNSKLANTIVINHYLPEKDLSITIPLGVSYESNLEHVEHVTLEVAREVLREVPGGVPDFEPVIRFHTFGDFSINCNVALRAREYADQFLLRHEFIKRLHKRYAKEGIIIPYPTRTIYVEQGKEIPRNHTEQQNRV
ncbi:MAG: mechanosensitive ion channel family protein [Bacteroidetes bacterium]|nr:mechanosensitive ion channel family protein [Bacteroidota bacterium]